MLRLAFQGELSLALGQGRINAHILLIELLSFRGEPAFLAGSLPHGQDVLVYGMSQRKAGAVAAQMAHIERFVSFGRRCGPGLVHGIQHMHAAGALDVRHHCVIGGKRLGKRSHTCQPSQ